jgi:hypothetical protein
VPRGIFRALSQEIVQLKFMQFGFGEVSVGRVFDPSAWSHHALDGLKTRPTRVGLIPRGRAPAKSSFVTSPAAKYDAPRKALDFESA